MNKTTFRQLLKEHLTDSQYQEFERAYREVGHLFAYDPDAVADEHYVKSEACTFISSKTL